MLLHEWDVAKIEGGTLFLVDQQPWTATLRLDTLENKERKIVYSTPKEFDTSLLKETWLIRSDVSLENYYPIQKKEANYYWIENQDMSIIKKVKELDKNSFIALWR